MKQKTEKPKVRRLGPVLPQTTRNAKQRVVVDGVLHSREFWEAVKLTAGKAETSRRQARKFARKRGLAYQLAQQTPAVEAA